MADAVISRLPPSIDLVLYAGDGVAFRFTVVKAVDDTPFAFDGEFASQIKVKRSDTNPVLTWAIDNSDISNGIVVISLTGEETESVINNGRSFSGVWDLQFTPNGAEPMTLVQGRVTCNADVTK